MDETGPANHNATFKVGPAHPVTDSRQLPAVTAHDEAGFVHGADVADHPDNVVPDADHVEDDLPSDDELRSVIAGVDVDDIDTVGFDNVDAAGLPGVDVAAADSTVAPQAQAARVEQPVKVGV